MTDERKIGLAKVFDTASDHYQAGPAFSWGLIGARLVEAAAPQPGERVLDVASGAGTTAIPAALAVGAEGSVTAVDLSRELLRFADEAAAEQGLTNLKTRVGDMEATGYDDGSFDVVLCSLGIFFVADIPAGIRELWRMVDSGGRLAISTWAGLGLEGVFEAFGDAVRDVWPDMPRDEKLPWHSISEETGLTAAFSAAGAQPPVVTRFSLTEPIASDRMWANFMGGGIRGLLDRFPADQQAQIRAGMESRLAERGITTFEYELLFAVATKPTTQGRG